MKVGPTVATLCDLLVRSNLLPDEKVQALQQRWLQGAGADAGLDSFIAWLVSNQFVTEYQAALLVQGHADHFFLGPYKLLERVGKGRLTTVYKAVHRLGQLVAIKVLPPSKARDPYLLACFLREAHLGGRLQHPNVVRIFQTAEANGLHYLVMEYLDGETLQEVLERRGKLPAPEAAQIVYQALQGLQHLHDQGLVHRNLEPANLMLVPPAGGSRLNRTQDCVVKVLDITFTRALFDETTPGSANHLPLTYEGMLLGTTAYLAPEQARDAHAADIRADIYSLGCIFYHLLTGQLPFPDSNPMRQATRHLTETPRQLRQLDPEIPEELDPIVHRMMAKDSEQRYPTPKQAAQDLEIFLMSGEPQPLPEPGPVLPSFLGWLEGSPPIGEAPAPLHEDPALKAVQPTPLPPVLSLTPVEEENRGPDVSTTFSAEDWESFPVSLSEENSGEYRWRAQPNRRDYLALLLGGLGMLAAQGVGLFLARILERKGRDNDPRSGHRAERGE